MWQKKRDDRLDLFIRTEIQYLSIREGGTPRITFNGLNYGDYKTTNPRVIRLFRDYVVRRGEWYPGPIDTIPSTMRFFLADGRSWSFQAYPRRPEWNGPGYMAALNALSDDLALQYAKISRRQLSGSLGIRDFKFYVPESHPSFARMPAPTAADIPAAVAALTRLDRRAFTFGERGTNALLGFFHADGKKTVIRLRPPVYKNREEAIRMADPPLPQPLWSWIYGKPQA